FFRQIAAAATVRFRMAFTGRLEQKLMQRQCDSMEISYIAVGYLPVFFQFYWIFPIRTLR
ncbi:hypothetical protein, partial [Paenibacillus macerans]|uniref:hypothetical protein n=1 Tax=Paenibacillus macerans TaxID=44252 RepID=UPI001C3F8C1D